MDRERTGQCVAWRNDYYRRTAYALAKENQILLLDPDDFAEIAKEPAPEKGERSAGSTVRFMTGPSMFRTYLEEAFTDTGGMILWTKDNTGSSKTCSICDKIKEDLGSARVSNYVNGHIADRELNACKNVMNAFLKNPGLFSTKKRLTMKHKEKAVEKAQKLAAGSAVRRQAWDFDPRGLKTIGR